MHSFHFIVIKGAAILNSEPKVADVPNFQTSKLKFWIQGFDDIGGLQLEKSNFQDRMECTIGSSKRHLVPQFQTVLGARL